MSVENLRVGDPKGKGWANLYMNNLTVYDTLTTKKIIMSTPPKTNAVDYRYNGSIVPKFIELLYTETGGLVTLQFIDILIGTLIPANNSNRIILTPVSAIDPMYKINYETEFPVSLFIDNAKELCSCRVAVDGTITFFRQPLPGNPTPNFIAGEDVFFTDGKSVTFVRG